MSKISRFFNMRADGAWEAWVLYMLRAGDVGTVVMVHAGGKGCEVEFTTLGGDTLSVLTLPAGGIASEAGTLRGSAIPTINENALRAIRADEIAHARAVA